MNEKTVKKAIPFSPYDLKGYEGYLEEMAAQGLIFERFASYGKAVFRVGEPKAMRYRLDPKGKLYNDPGRKEAYRDADWTFEDSLGPWFYLFSCADPAVPDLHTDPATLAYALNQTIRRYWWWAAPFMIACLLPVFLFCVLPELRVDLVLWRNQAWSFVFLSVCALICALCFYIELRKLYKLRRTLAQGLTPKPGRRQIVIPVLLVLVLFWGMRIGLDVYRYTSRHETTDLLPLEQLELVRDWPALRELEATAEQIPEKTAQWTASGQINHSLLAPVQEHTWHSNTKWLGGAMYQSQLSTDYIQTSTPLLADWIFDSLLDENDSLLSWLSTANSGLRVEDYQGFAEILHPELDRLMVARFRQAYQDSFCFVARKGSQVLGVTYTGFGAFEDCLELYIDALVPEAG